MPSTDRYSSPTNTNQPTITRTVTKSVVPVGSTDLVDPDVVFTKKHEEWTTSKRIVNHKTKQVETRVQRQLVLEDGRVVADSGPQVTTKTKEDTRVEESENTEHKTTGDDAPGDGYVMIPGSAKVIREKTESNQTMTETREENKQMHDEHIRDLSGEEIHQRTIISPDDPSFGNSIGEFPGKLTHFSSRSQKIVDKDEVKEISELKDGEVTTETTRTHHHEEAYDDEVPEEEAEEGMVPERSAETSRTIQYYTDPQEFQNVSDRLEEESRRSRIQNHRQNGTSELPAVTHRWVDDHFGAQKEIGNDVRGESTRTRSGGNRITIEMSPHRSSPSELSPRSTLNKHDRSRDSTLRNKASSSAYRVEYSPSPPYPPSTPVHRSTASPFEVSSSSGSSRSKTPVKTFYLGEDNTYQRDHINSWKKKSNHSLADAVSSSLSIGDTNSLGRSNLSGHYGERSDSFCRVPRSKVNEPLRYEAFNNGPIYSKVSRVRTDKNVQVSMSDDEDDSTLKRRNGRDHSVSPNRFNGNRSHITLPRTVKISHEPAKPSYSTNSLSHSKYYKSSDSLHSPGYSSYYSSNDYGTSFRNASSPIYNNSSFHRDARNSDIYRKSDWNSSNYNDTYSKNRVHEVKINRASSQDHLANGRSTKTKSPASTNWYNSSSSLKTRKIPTSPPESGYQSPFPPTPPSSPPPRVIKVLNSDHYGSSSSMSPPDSPIHATTSSIRKKSAYPSGSASRSKSSGDLRTSQLFAPESFSPLASPLKLKTVGEKKDQKDRQKYYRVKPGQDGQSVVVQVRDWNGR
ncbi:serine/arginine repetitive matrix protein 4-like [Uloborus diversus]|uniref:serine/arginine repetitive matrix protein 4-like n=1 Tax=Uloborus diversus TaxID=327109 RepID=UPI002409BACB|nr:serine/arginine repetitive matrix protein 4-like [Uloborus diversus]